METMKKTRAFEINAQELSDAMDTFLSCYKEIMAIADTVQRLSLRLDERYGKRNLSKSEFARYARISTPTLRKYINEGRIESVRVGKREMIPEGELVKFTN